MKDDPILTEEQQQAQRFTEIIGWDAEFIKVEQAVLFDMILVCSYFQKKIVHYLLTPHIYTLTTDIKFSYFY